MNAMPKVLKVDIAGLPVKWIEWEVAAGYYASNKVQWELGDEKIVLRGGRNKIGERTILEVSPIISVSDKSRGMPKNPRLTNRALFHRDGHICMYCVKPFSTSKLSRDHILPVSRGGPDTWENCTTACVSCNNEKSDMTPEEWGVPLAAVPYAPSFFDWMIVSNRRIISDQMDFLKSFRK